MTARMDGGELQCRREYLGLTTDVLAAILKVNPRTVRSWESGRDPIPERIGDEVAAIEAATAEQVQSVVEGVDFGDPDMYVYRDAETRSDMIGRMGARWWRHVVARARELNPGIVIRTAGDDADAQP